LGIGIAENTAIAVSGDQCEVIGESGVAIYDANYRDGKGNQFFYFLLSGDRFDLKARRVNKKLDQ